MHSRAHAFLTHPLAASSLAIVGNPGWQLVANNTQPAMTTPISIFRDFSVFSPQNFLGPSPHLGMAMQTTFSPYRLVKVS